MPLLTGACWKIERADETSGGFFLVWVTDIGNIGVNAAGVATPQYLTQTGTSIKIIIQLQSMGHMNLKNNTPRMHHITPF